MSDIRIFDQTEWEYGSMSVADANKLMELLTGKEVLPDTRTVLRTAEGITAETSDHRAVGWIAHHGLNREVETYVFMPKGGDGYPAWFASRL